MSLSQTGVMDGGIIDLRPVNNDDEYMTKKKYSARRNTNSPKNSPNKKRTRSLSYSSSKNLRSSGKKEKSRYQGMYIKKVDEDTNRNRQDIDE